MKNILIAFLIGFSCVLNAQTIIELNNPSFEDLPSPSKSPNYWVDCNEFGESPIDIQPGFFEVELKAYEGKTYLGMLARNNNTWESVAQELKSPLLKSQPYIFDIQLARSPSYLSYDRKNELIPRQERVAYSNIDGEQAIEMINYTEPTILRIWGGNDFRDKRQLLTQTAPVYNNSWEQYTLEFIPVESWKYIMLEVYFTEGREGEYCGHLLLDNCSKIRPIDLLIYNQKNELSPTSLDSKSIHYFSSTDIKNTLQYIIRKKSSIIADNQITHLTFLKKMDDLTFLNNLTFNEIRYIKQLEILDTYVQYLDEIGLEEELDILKKMLQIIQVKKEQKISKEDKKFIKENRSTLIKDFFKGTIDNYIENYIELRKEEIIEEIILCME